MSFRVSENITSNLNVVDLKASYYNYAEDQLSVKMYIMRSLDPYRIGHGLTGDFDSGVNSFLVYM